MSRKIVKISNGSIQYVKQPEIWTHATHVNGWEPAVYMSCMSQNFRLFHVSNLSVLNFPIVLLMYLGPVTLTRAGPGRWRALSGRRRPPLSTAPGRDED